MNVSRDLANSNHSNNSNGNDTSDDSIHGNGAKNVFRKLKQDSINVKEKMANLSSHISSGLNIISSNIIGEDFSNINDNKNQPRAQQTSILNYSTGTASSVNMNYNDTSPRINLPPQLPLSSAQYHHKQQQAIPTSPNSTQSNKTPIATASPVLSSVFDRKASIRNVQNVIQNNPIAAALGLAVHPQKDNESTSSSTNSNYTGNSSNSTYEISDYKNTQFENVLQADIIDMTALRKLAWNGIPSQHRTFVWQLLLNYLPTNKSRREHVIATKRKEYYDLIPVYYQIPETERTNNENDTLRQILKDLPRTCPDSPFFQQEPIQRMMERILFIWSVRHPACGYVQGMDDLLTPIIYQCIQPLINSFSSPSGSSSSAPSTATVVFRMDVSRLDAKVLKQVEADSYWCFTKLLDNVHDHFIFSQPGLQRMILLLEDLIHRLDLNLYAHFQTESLQYMQFGFRWMNCLLIRELPFPCILRLWDTYLSEQYGGFENFHVYVCAVLLKTFQNEVITLPYEELLMFLQDMPTKDWTVDDMEPILSQAFILSTLFENAPNHLS